MLMAEMGLEISYFNFYISDHSYVQLFLQELYERDGFTTILLVRKQVHWPMLPIK